MSAAKHPSPLWVLPDASDDRVGYAGEAKGVWLSMRFWPAFASLLLLERMLLTDLREFPPGPAEYGNLMFGAPSGRLLNPKVTAAPPTPPPETTLRLG